VSTEVASTRLPKEILRQIDREASARGVSRSVHLAEVIERRCTEDSAVPSGGQIETLLAELAGELRQIRETQRSLAHALRDIQGALRTGGQSPEMGSAAPLLERLAFSTFFSENLIKRVSALLYRHPGELSQVVREAREQADAEAKLWRERLKGAGFEKGSP
jgi:hypothetical protein